MPSTNPGRQPALDTAATRSRAACPVADKLAYVLPKVEQSVSNDSPPSDVVAEWAGLTPTLSTSDVAADSPASKTQKHTSFDSCASETTSIRYAFWKRQNDVLAYPIDGDALLFHPEMKLLCQLNETAFFIWQHCDGRCVEDLAVMLTEAFNVEIDTATDHAMKIIELFSISGFVVEESFHAVPS